MRFKFEKKKSRSMMVVELLLGVVSMQMDAGRATAAATCPSSMHVVEGQCIVGTAYRFLKNTTTVDICCSLCAADAGKCSGFLLRNTTGGKVECVLKTGPVTQQRPGCIASGTFAPSPPPNPPPPHPSPPPPPTDGLTVSDMLLGVGGAVPVLQRDTTVSIWGTAAPDAVVKVELVGYVALTL